MKRTHLALMSVAMAGGFLAPSAAQASFILRLSSGDSIFIVNNDPTNTATQKPDGNPDNQLISYTNTNFGGAFSLTVTTGFSNSSGSALGAILQVNTIDIRNFTGAAANLHVQLEDTGFLIPSGNNLQLESSLSGNLFFANVGDEVDFQSWADSSNGQGGKVTTPGLQSYVVTSIPLGFQSTIPQPDTIDTPFASVGPNPYSLTNALDIKLSAGAQGNIVGTTSVIPNSGSTPEPASLLLLGLGSVSLLRRRVRA